MEKINKNTEYVQWIVNIISKQETAKKWPVHSVEILSFSPHDMLKGKIINDEKKIFTMNKVPSYINSNNFIQNYKKNQYVQYHQRDFDSRVLFSS